MKKFIGIDRHSNNSVVVVSDEEDRVLFQKRMANDLKQREARAQLVSGALNGDGRELAISPLDLFDIAQAIRACVPLAQPTVGSGAVELTSAHILGNVLEQLVRGRHIATSWRL